MVAQYKRVIEVFIQLHPIPAGLLILGHGRCMARRSGHRCRGRVSAVAVTQFCPYHQIRSATHHSTLHGNILTDKLLFFMIYNAQNQNTLDRLLRMDNALQTMVPGIIGIGAAARDMPLLVGRARNQILSQQHIYRTFPNGGPAQRMAHTAIERYAADCIQQLEDLHATVRRNMWQVGDALDALNMLSTTM